MHNKINIFRANFICKLRKPHQESSGLFSSGIPIIPKENYLFAALSKVVIFKFFYLLCWQLPKHILVNRMRNIMSLDIGGYTADNIISNFRDRSNHICWVIPLLVIFRIWIIIPDMIIDHWYLGANLIFNFPKPPIKPRICHK